MMLITKDKTTLERISKNGKVWDYPLPSEEIGIALQELNGQVPENGWYKNKVCDEVCYIISGQAKFYIGDNQYDVKEGDVVVIKVNVKSRIKANNLKMITITKPNWYRKQCEIIKE